ncbi:MAG: hypothetical protein ACRDZ9_08350 [Acidimicrobiales bacterium]
MTGASRRRQALPPAATTLQERVEASTAGRWVISGVLVVVLASIALWNMPDSGLRRSTSSVVEPFVSVTGLRQQWNLFAPDPPRRSSQIFARVDYADGTSATWSPPHNDRWRKWLGTIRLAQFRQLQAPFARWVADDVDHGGRRPVRVALLERVQELRPPGSAEDRSAPTESEIVTIDLDDQGRGR